jgi:hypothetical protein
MAASPGISKEVVIGGVALVLILVVVAYIALTPGRNAYQTYQPPPEQRPAGIGGLAGILGLFI